MTSMMRQGNDFSKLPPRTEAGGMSALARITERASMRYSEFFERMPVEEHSLRARSLTEGFHALLETGSTRHMTTDS